jgi:hypothetical protein
MSISSEKVLARAVGKRRAEQEGLSLVFVGSLPSSDSKSGRVVFPGGDL